MMASKSVLNPYNSPYVPLSEMFFGMRFEETNKAGKGIILGESEGKNTANSPVTGSTSSYGIQHTVKLDNFEKLPTQIGQRSGAPDTQTLQEGAAEYEDFGGLNNGNLNEAIDMLEQFESEGFYPSDFPETSEARNNFDPASLEGSSSGTSDARLIVRVS